MYLRCCASRTCWQTRPAYHRTARLHHNAPWYNNNIRSAKRQRRKLERRWRKTRLECHREAYREQCSTVNVELQKAKYDFYHTKLTESTSQKEIYGIGNDLLFGKTATKLPTHDSVSDLAEAFADYFADKIKAIRNGMCHDIKTVEEHLILSVLSSFKPATEDEVSKIIRNIASKSCSLDPLPTWLLKLCLGELLPVITCIVNLSVSTSNVPDAL